MEQRSFNELTQDMNTDTLTSEELEMLTTALCESQTRLTRFCQLNQLCFSQVSQRLFFPSGIHCASEECLSSLLAGRTLKSDLFVPGVYSEI